MISLDIFPPINHSSNPAAVRSMGGLPVDAPAILFAPGLRCHSQDLPGTSVVRACYKAGFRAVVVNRRGHTPKRKLRSPRWSLFGDIDDMEQVYWHVRDELLPGAPLFLDGLSSGSAVVIDGLGVWDARRRAGDESAPSFVAAVAVSPGYDISTCLERFRWPFKELLLHNVQSHFVKSNEEVLRKFDADAVDKCLRTNSLQRFLDHAAPFTGYKDKDTFYSHTNPVRGVHNITTPTLIFSAKDDMCCKFSNAHEVSPYPAHRKRTYAQLVADSPAGVLAQTNSGSHCPFLDGWLFPFTHDPISGPFGMMLESYADRATAEFFRACLEEWGSDEFEVKAEEPEGEGDGVR